ncbi:hypothetical protein ABW19_dt0208196 [Dactylella cylindrospora]|nr:hypothetical protein ABW19_dt0208196 [Dactylella cylindrospora]
MPDLDPDILDPASKVVPEPQDGGPAEPSPNRAAPPPARNPPIPPMASQTEVKVPLSGWAIADLANRRGQVFRSFTTAESSILATLRQENHNRSRKSSDVADTELIRSSTQEESLERMKENLAPIPTQQPSEPRNSIGGEVPAASSMELVTDSQDNLDVVGAPTAVSGHFEMPDLRPVFGGRLIHDLQSIYTGTFPGSDMERRYLLRSLEDPFNARYAAAFDVFYNARRFFEQPSGTILDSSMDELTISAGTVSGKSIYGVYIDEPQLFTHLIGIEPSPKVPPNTPNATNISQRIAEDGSMGESTNPRKLAEGHTNAHSNETSDTQAGKTSTQPTYINLERPAIPPRRLPTLKGLPSSQETYGGIRYPLQGAAVTPPRTRDAVLKVSPPHSSIALYRKRNSPLRPKAVMAWWKERDAATSGSDGLNRVGMVKPPSRQSSRGSRSSLSNDGLSKKQKHKKRNPLRRFSALFGKRRASNHSLKSTAMSNGSHKSLKSLPSQVFIPECKQGTPSFITTDIVKNRPTSIAPGAIEDVNNKTRQTSGSSIVRQRISSFETPRPVQVEKKYQTSPSYQMLNTLKPVRGRSMKERYEKTGDTSTPTGKRCEDIPPKANVLPKEPSPTGSNGGVLVADVSLVSDTSNSAFICSGNEDPEADTSRGLSALEKEIGLVPKHNSSGGDTSGLSSIFQDIYDAEVAIGTPDLLDPRIITSTPIRDSGRSSPKLLSEDVSIAGPQVLKINQNATNTSLQFEHSTDPISTSCIVQEPNDGVSATYLSTKESKLLAQKPTSQSTSLPSMEVIDNDENKENIAPDESYRTFPEIPSTAFIPSPRIARFEADFSGLITETQKYISRKHQSLQKRSLRLVKSALDSFKFGTSSQGKRSSVLGLFKLSRSSEVDPLPHGATSFRILPTIDSPHAEYEIPNKKSKSGLRARLGRKKKPILAVPKYPKKNRSRGSLFNLFDFNRSRRESSFIVHQDSKLQTPRKTSEGSNETIASRIQRRFSILPLFKRRIFSAPTGPSVDVHIHIPPEGEASVNRSFSPPPRLELQLSRSGLEA